MTAVTSVAAAVCVLGASVWLAPGSAVAISRGVPVSRTYVALGDSYTSGPGLPAQLDSATSPSAPGVCARSAENYPTLVAKDLGYSLDDVSCLGATTEDLFESQGPGIAPQLSALTRSTALVSLSIGGNDLGFTSIATNCAAVTPWGATKVGWSCATHYMSHGVNELDATIRQVGEKVTNALSAIKSRSPHARVFVVGYPDIVPSVGSGCWPKLPFSAVDITFVRGVEATLNTTLAQAAVRAGDTYANVAAPSAAHDACTAVDSRWVEPIAPLHGGFPLHPSTVGMEGMARVLEEAIGGSPSH